MVSFPRKSVQVSSSSKINLHLKVLSKSVDGYHGIETIYQRIALSDEITISLDDSGKRTVITDWDVGEGTSNLAYRAAESFCALSEWNTGFEIVIAKNIPVGAGLGGGSADAAATLRAMNRLAALQSPDHILNSIDLMAVASSLGADVPFLTSNFDIALAWGRGNHMMSLPTLPRRRVIILAPEEVSVSTAEAYSWIAPNADFTEPSIFTLEKTGSWKSLALQSENDFTQPVSARHPEVAEAISILKGIDAQMVNMTGTGSAVYGIFPWSDDEVWRAKGSVARAQIEEKTRGKFRIIETETTGAI